MAISVSAVEYVISEGRKFTILKNERVNTGAGILKDPIMPLPTLLLGLFGTTADFYLKSSDNYNPVTGSVTNDNQEVITADIYLEAQTIESSTGTGQLQSSGIIYVPGEAFGYETTALLLLTVQETGEYQRHVETP